MIFPTMLAPHRTTHPANSGILTQLSEDTGYLWCGLLGQAHRPAIRLALWPHFPDHINPSKCPLGSRGGNYFLAYIRSQMNPHMCAKFGANLSSRLADFPHFFLFLTPKTPHVPPSSHVANFYFAHYIF